MRKRVTADGLHMRLYVTQLIGLQLSYSTTTSVAVIICMPIQLTKHWDMLNLIWTPQWCHKKIIINRYTSSRIYAVGFHIWVGFLLANSYCIWRHTWLSILIYVERGLLSYKCKVTQVMKWVFLNGPHLKWVML